MVAALDRYNGLKKMAAWTKVLARKVMSKGHIQGLSNRQSQLGLLMDLRV